MTPHLRLPAGPARLGFDAHRIAPKLYQGAVPPEGDVLARRGFDMVVLTAAEHQPPATRFRGVEVVHAGYHDAIRLSPIDLARAKIAASKVATALGSGKRVLVTCYMGHNRSGLVSALALYLLAEGRLTGRDAVVIVQSGRPGALRNQAFVAMLEGLPARWRRRR